MFFAIFRGPTNGIKILKSLVIDGTVKDGGCAFNDNVLRTYCMTKVFLIECEVYKQKAKQKANTLPYRPSKRG